MGSCCSCHVAYGGKVYDLECGSNRSNYDIECEHGEDRVILRGSSNFVSMYSQKGTKGVNQDAMTVWEDFTGRKDMIFCGIFDGHGPLGHTFARYTRDNLPSKLSAAIKQSPQNISKDYDAKAADTSNKDDFCGEDNQNMSLATWEGRFSKSFLEMDEDLARNVDIDGFCGGCTAVTLIKQDDQLIVGNLGDSRAVLCTRADDNHLVAVQLTVDLKPDVPSEALRINTCGGKIFAAKGDSGVNRLWRPEAECPGLAMSRAFGNFCLKNCGLTSIPDVSHRNVTKQDEFVVLATDGVWDVLTNSEVINIVASAPNRSKAAHLLVKHAVQGWRRKCGYKVDDCTVICLFLK